MDAAATIAPAQEMPHANGSGIPQHLMALEQANRVRLARASLKRSVAEGATKAAEVVAQCPWEAESMTVSELLMSQRRWGRKRCRKFLLGMGLHENKELGTMTERQRLVLSSALEAKADAAGRRSRGDGHPRTLAAT